MMTLKKCWQRGIEPFLFFDEFNAHRIDGAPLTDSDRIFIRMNKNEIMEEIRGISAGIRIEGEQFFGGVYRDKFRGQCHD